MIYKTLFALSAAVVPIILNYWLKHHYKTKINKIKILYNQVDSNYYHCLFFTRNNLKCREHIINYFECGSKCSTTHLQTLLKLLGSAKYSISLCMYHLTMKQILNQLCEAANRGVNVRIITDCTISKMDHSTMKHLKEKYGFDVRTPKIQHSLMHHKYCLIDEKNSDLQKLFFGSLNLTLQACVANFEVVVITNNPSLIKNYEKDFELLWECFI